MLTKKYTFESKSTRVQRLIVSAFIVIAFTVAVTISFIVYIPIYARMQKGRAAGAFYQKSPDAIAVFTGDRGRISYALEHLTKNPSAKLFISGVYAANSFQTLLDKQVGPVPEETVKNPGMQVELDYDSKNTFQNVAETVEFLKVNPEVKKVLIISSDYHIMRIKFILSHFMQGSPQEFYFDSVTSSYESWDDVRKLLKEAVKIVRSFVILKVFRENIVQE